MSKGELYATPENQYRIVLGHTPSGDVAFAVRGADAHWDYDHSEIRQRGTFDREGAYLWMEHADEVERVCRLFEHFICDRNIA